MFKLKLINNLLTCNALGDSEYIQDIIKRSNNQFAKDINDIIRNAKSGPVTELVNTASCPSSR